MLELEELYSICIKKIISNSSVVFSEPYIPHIPLSWNGILVLAESQNLSNSNSEYVSRLKLLSPRERIFRLGKYGQIGVYPWDDGSLKITVEAMFNGIQANEVAVSNAVLWSQVDNGKNINPSEEIQKYSSEIWESMLELMKPRKIVCCGKIGKKVIDATGWQGEIIFLRLPARTVISRVSSMFSEQDLLERFPEVNAVIDRHREWLGDRYQLNKIFFACHAVSLCSNIQQ